MMRSRILGVVAAGAMTATGVALLPMNAAHAATTYTWVAGWDGTGSTIPGADHKSWDIAANWSPAGVPGSGDTVVLTNAPASNGNVQSSTELYVPAGGKTVASLRIEQPHAGSVRLIDGSVNVTGAFDWTGGEVRSRVTIGSGANGRIGAGQLKPLLARMTIAGSLTLENLGDDPDTELQMYPDYDGDDDGIAVTATGTLRATGANLLAGTGCCTDPAKIVNQGTVEVTSGQTTLKAVEVDQLGTAKVAPGARLTQTTGPVRLGAGASYRGGGTVEFVDTASIRSNPNTVPVPGGILMQGTGILADNTRLLFGMGAKLTGVGGFTGPGLLDFDAVANSGQQSATVYGDLATGSATLVRFAGAYPARLSSWDPGLKGYHGVLRIGGTASVLAGKSFIPAAGTSTVIGKGGRLNLAPGSTWGGGDCCTQPARLAISPGATLAVPSGSGSAAHVVRVDLRNSGTLDLASGKRLATTGYPVTLGGTLRVVGRTAPKAVRTVVTGSGIKGRFGCVSPGGQVATYSSTAVRLAGTLGSFSGCAKQVSKKLVATTLKKRQKVKAKVKGVPKSVKKVLLAVTIAGPAKKAKLKVGGAVVKVPAKRTTMRYVVAKRTGGKVTVVNSTKKKMRVKIVLVGIPRA